MDRRLTALCSVEQVDSNGLVYMEKGGLWVESGGILVDFGGVHANSKLTVTGGDSTIIGNTRVSRGATVCDCYTA